MEQIGNSLFYLRIKGIGIRERQKITIDLLIERID